MEESGSGDAALLPLGGSITPSVIVKPIWGLHGLIPTYRTVIRIQYDLHRKLQKHLMLHRYNWRVPRIA